MGNEELHNELNDFENQLRRLEPRESRVDRDRLMFLAGQALQPAPARQALHWSRWIWPTITSVSCAATLCLALRLLQISELQISEPKIAQRVAEPTSATKPSLTQKEKMVNGLVPVEPQHRVVSTSVDALPSPSSYSQHSFPARSYLQAREVAIQLGIDALPPSFARANIEPENRSPLQAMDRRLLEKGDQL